MDLRRAIVSYFFRSILNVICKINCREFVDALSKNKPMIVVLNHINFLEVPIIVTHSYPLKVTGVVKVETWKNPIMAFLFNTYRAIPIDRSGAFTEVSKRVRRELENGFFTCIAPEGTRSKNGILGRGKAGVVQIALDAGVPILPVAHYGGEHIWENMKRLRRTSFCFKVGKMFKLKIEGRPGKEERDEILSEVMGQIACLLPENMRGVYAQQAERGCKHLDFLS